MALFRGAERGYAEQSSTGESFDQDLIFGSFHDRDKVIREFFEDGHELRYTGPGDAEVGSSGSLCSLRVFF